MSIKKNVRISCPKCSHKQNVELYESINIDENPDLKNSLFYNSLNRIACENCEFDFRVDLPFVYLDPKNKIFIHLIPENQTNNFSEILNEFDVIIESISFASKKETDLNIRLVTSRSELIELIYMTESNINQRIIEYIKYEIYEKNKKKLNPENHRLLLNIEDSSPEKLMFVIQNINTKELLEILEYARSGYTSLKNLYIEDPEEFLQMFPGPCISARYLLLEKND